VLPREIVRAPLRSDRGRERVYFGALLLDEVLIGILAQQLFMGIPKPGFPACDLFQTVSLGAGLSTALMLPRNPANASYRLVRDADGRDVFHMEGKGAILRIGADDNEGDIVVVDGEGRDPSRCREALPPFTWKLFPPRRVICVVLARLDPV
jgi:hypothetical protein